MRCQGNAQASVALFEGTRFGRHGLSSYWQVLSSRPLCSCSKCLAPESACLVTGCAGRRSEGFVCAVPMISGCASHVVVSIRGTRRNSKHMCETQKQVNGGAPDQWWAMLWKICSSSVSFSFAVQFFLF